MRRRILEELDEVERDAPGTIITWSPSEDELDYKVRVRESEYLLSNGYIRGDIGGDQWINARITPMGRDHLDSLRSTATASVTKTIIPVPAELPGEWKELARGIAIKHNFNAEPHLTEDGILLVLTTYADPTEAQISIPRIRAEIERALAQPSRMKNNQHNENVFINNGQAGAMGTNPIASGNTFQQQNNIEPLAGQEQQQLIEQIERWFEALRSTATDPDHFTALAEVKRAQLAAKSDGANRSRVIEALKKTGDWAFKVAEKIGVEVITKLIKDQA